MTVTAFFSLALVLRMSSNDERVKTTEAVLSERRANGKEREREKKVDVRFHSNCLLSFAEEELLAESSEKEVRPSILS